MLTIDAMIRIIKRISIFISIILGTQILIYG